MRWLVEVTSLGRTEKDSLYVDAESWQKALQVARTLRGETDPMSGFSIELLDEGCRAVDPATRISYEVRRAPEEARPGVPRPSTPPPRPTGAAEAPAPPSAHPSVPPPATHSVVQATAPQAVVQPAAPQAVVQPAAPQAVVQPAAPQALVQPAAAPAATHSPAPHPAVSESPRACARSSRPGRRSPRPPR